MVANTRWVGYAVDASGQATDGNGQGCKGTMAYSMATASVGDKFTIGPTTNQLNISIDGDPGPYITLQSGTDFDPRFIAKEITEKMHALGKSNDSWNAARCVWTNDKAQGNCFEIYSGTLGSSASVSVSISSSAAQSLGFDSSSQPGGTAGSYGFSGDVTVSGTYYGFVDELYKIVITNDTYADASVAPRGIGVPDKNDLLNSYSGVMSTGGVFNGGSDITYVLNIDVANGNIMGAGTDGVPLLTWTSTGGDGSTTNIELLYPDYWYKVGDEGLMVKFTDAVFSQASPAWTIDCKAAQYAYGSSGTATVGNAEYVWASDRGEYSSSPVTTASGAPTQLGSRGLSITFNPSGSPDTFNAGDEFYVICKAPKPSDYDITSLNYGNVTVSTDSEVKCVIFEVTSGAVEVSTVKFGLQSQGSFSYHENDKTMFRFGTVGPSENAGDSPNDGIEWWPDVVYGDIDSDTAPDYLYKTKRNLSVTATADNSEDIGSTWLMSDPMWLCIRLDSGETGANSGINYRLYFDYS